MLAPLADRIAAELAVKPTQVNAAIGLLDEGATVPFIARYRKEVTGGLDDTQLRQLAERLVYMRELEERRETILKTIDEQGKLTPELRKSVLLAETKQRLEDLYLPYKVKRRTKAQIALEAGLEPLADALLTDPKLVPEDTAADYLREPFTTEAGDNPGVADTKAALDGAGAILMERFAENAELLEQLRTHMSENALLTSTLAIEEEQKAEKFRDYFAFSEPLHKVPSHRALALFRGRSEGVLRLALVLPEEQEAESWRLALGVCEQRIARHFGIEDQGRAADAWLAGVVRLTWRAKLGVAIDTHLLSELRTAAEAEAIRVFARNLRDLLLAAPAGAHTTLGLDPGIRTGVKVAVVDATGKLKDTQTIYPFAPRNDVAGSLAALNHLVSTHGVSLVAIGNGTASRETDALVQQLRKDNPGLQSIVVSEAGASVYSASELAAREFPDLDVSLRGAVSIARRLQDPLAELVKIDPKSIGVGQYQHDVSQHRLTSALDDVVEDCVNSVGVNLNTASAPLLARVAGLSTGIADNVVELRDARGAFKRREELLDVPRLGAKTFEQAAGFLRIVDGDNPLDASAVHPEAYPLVQRILGRLQHSVGEVMGSPQHLRGVDAQQFVDDQFGLPTVQDIFSELEKPGRDPRPEFKTATFKEGVNELKDLQPDMVLEGVVTNVTNFGAFVDVGVHQDGLVHISALADRFVKDPHDVVKAGDVVRVKVLEVDVQRKRIGLTMRLREAGAEQAPTGQGSGDARGGRQRQQGSGQDGGRRNDRGGRHKGGQGRGGQNNSGQDSSGKGRGKQRHVPDKPMGAMAAAFAKAKKR